MEVRKEIEGQISQHATKRFSIQQDSPHSLFCSTLVKRVELTCLAACNDLPPNLRRSITVFSRWRMLFGGRC